jgi:hypothetical protein
VGDHRGNCHRADREGSGERGQEADGERGTAGEFPGT